MNEQHPLERQARREIVEHLEAAQADRQGWLKLRHTTDEERVTLTREIERIDVLIAWVRSEREVRA